VWAAEPPEIDELRKPVEVQVEGSGTEFFRARRMLEEATSERDRSLAACAGACQAAFAALAIDSHLGAVPARRAVGRGLEPADLILNASYLLDRSGQEAVERAARSLESEFASLGLRVAMDGPFPPFHFVSADVLSVEPAPGVG
jgi:hypothetical protein